MESCQDKRSRVQCSEKSNLALIDPEVLLESDTENEDESVFLGCNDIDLKLNGSLLSCNSLKGLTPRMMMQKS